MPSLKSTSKYLSLILRHHPEAAALPWMNMAGRMWISSLLGQPDAAPYEGAVGGNRPHR